MSDITLTEVRSGYNLGKINENFTKVEDKVNNGVLHTSGGKNIMGQNLDMNGNRILNLPAPINDNEPARLIDLNPALNAAVDGLLSVREETLAITSATTVYVFASARPIAGSGFYIRDPNGDAGAKLVEGLDFIYRPDLGEYALELLRSWPDGHILQRVYNSFSGAANYTSLSNKPNLSSAAEMQAAVTFGLGESAVLSTYGNALYTLRNSSYTALSGDITRVDGKVWELQRGADGNYNLLNFGAVSDGGDQQAAFNAAALRAGSNCCVVVPQGVWVVGANTSSATTWVLLAGADIGGLGGVSPTFEKDTSRLLGTVIDYASVNSWNTLRVGDPKFTVQKLTNKAFSAEIEGNSDNAAGGLLGTTYASARTTVDASRHAVSGIAVNDSNDLTGVWAGYLEAYILPSTNGNSFCLESTTFNANNTINVVDTPNLTLTGRQGLTYNAWLTTGGDAAFAQPMYDSTAAIGILGKGGTWGAQYDKGIICKNDTIASREFCAIPTELRYTWWEDKGTGDLMRSYIEGDSLTSDGRFKIGVYDSGTTSYREVIVRNTSISAPDNTFDLGLAPNRWKEIFSVNGTINTSDERYKTLEDITATEKAVALAIKASMKKFKWNESIAREEAGGDKARVHFGVGAQTVQSIFAANGLDANDYSLLCYDSWEMQPEIINSKGEVTQEYRAAGNRYGVRYTELLAFIISAL